MPKTDRVIRCQSPDCLCTQPARSRIRGRWLCMWHATIMPQTVRRPMYWFTLPARELLARRAKEACQHATS